MSSAICQNFVQNAWKKELCSNCFKSKDEHAAKPKIKPIPIVTKKKVESIIKKDKKSKTKLSVCFPSDNITEIIGVGGEDWISDCDDAEDENDLSESSEEDFTAESEEDDELQRITKENTNFNMTSLADVIEVKKSYTQLRLGKPLVDSDGKKQTLLVSVTPFGEESSTPIKKFTKTFSHIPISKTSKETLVETKTNVVLTSYTKNAEEKSTKEEKSLLDEINETLEKSKNPIQIISRKKTQKEIVLSCPKMNNKENEESSVKTKIVEEKEKTEKRVSLTRTPALKRDQEKPVIYQTSSAKIELLNNKNLRLSGGNNNNNKIVENNNEKPPEEKLQLAVISADFIKAEIANAKVTGLPPQVPKYQIPHSREQPDGQADNEVDNELPALPLTPPPILETQSSFLHTSEKPKVPSKPATVLIRKPVNPNQHLVHMQPLTTFSSEKNNLLAQQNSNESDYGRAGNKRRAPRSPEDNEVYLRKSAGDTLQVKEKRTSQKIVNETYYTIPEPAPRKSLSVSTDSLASTCGEERRKEKNKGRFSLKKFLRMGSSKDLPKAPVETPKLDDSPELAPQPKPRLIIVHPTELNGAKVEVMPKSPLDTTNNPQTAPKAKKPPPPPRNYEEWNRNPKPNLPHPPKSVEILNKQRQISRSNSTVKKTETVYANIGEVRSAMVPNKPQRTASMREREAQQQQHLRKHSDNYEPITVRNSKNNENVYDYINSNRSSSPDDSDSSRGKNSPKSKIIRLNKRSESSIDVSGDYFKYSNIPRSMSLTYCGSETESEIYSPYSFYGSESEVTEDDHDWIQNGRTHKLRSRKGRSIVHKNLEDNYGAVVVANHEALAQVLENIQQTAHIQPALRGLKTCVNLSWTDFSLKAGSKPVIVGRRAFHQALWGAQHVTLVVNAGSATSSALSMGAFTLTPVTEFSDLIPSHYLPQIENEDDGKPKQASVTVLPWLQVDTIHSYSETLRVKAAQNEETWRDASFIMLQLVNALKTLQAQGIEELPLSLSSFILCKEMDRETHHRLCVLQGLASELSNKLETEKHGSLCICASKVLTTLQPTSKTTPLIQSLLNNERAVSLTQVKSILEFTLWGPSDVALGSTIRERELALQRWLDLQRATVLHGLVCTRVQLTVYEEYHLLFLVRSNARMMCDASLLIESSNMKHNMASGHNNKAMIKN